MPRALSSSDLHRYVLQGTQPARRASGVCKVSVKYTDSRTAAAKTQETLNQSRSLASRTSTMRERQANERCAQEMASRQPLSLVTP